MQGSRLRRPAGGTTVPDIEGGPTSRGGAVPEYMDVHKGMHGITPDGLTEAHRADVDIQGDEGVDFKHAWADPTTGMVFCLSEAPSEDAVNASTSAPGIPRTRSTRSRSSPEPGPRGRG